MQREILLVTLPMLAFAVAPSVANAREAKSPNVIYILADDLGYADLSCYGQKKFETPNIDKMAERGVRFTQTYAGCTVSAPSRNSLMTGQHTGHTYVRGNKGMVCSDGRKYDTPLPASTITLGDIFQAEGYKTACIGKWGLGGVGTDGHPNKQGFDYFYGYLGQAFAHNYYPYFLHENTTEVRLEGKHYTHDLIEQKALNFIKENSKNPFFLYLTFTIPHAALQLPADKAAPFEGRYSEDKPYVNKGGGYKTQLKPHQTFAAMVTRLDESVGLVFEELKRLGIDDNTLVIFSSDNGAHEEGGADPKFFNSTGIYRGVKRDLYEGGIRVPMIATLPGIIPKNRVCDEMVAFWDMMPTFCELIGAEHRGEDGISIMSALRGKKLPKREAPLYWEFHEQGGKQAVRDGDWKLIKLEARDSKKTKYELYNIVNDPSEETNLIEKDVAVAERLKKSMAAARSENEIFKL